MSGTGLPWKPNGIVTWTTDFGLENGFVAAMQGVLLGLAPNHRWVDVTHGIPAQDIGAAALELGHVWSYFPKGTLHMVVVDPGVGTERNIIGTTHAGHAFVGPDNGVLPGALGPNPGFVRLDPAPWSLPQPSATFHGRDLFTPIAGALLRGDLLPTTGAACPTPVASQRPLPQPLGSSSYRLTVERIDRFGNLITNWSVPRDGALPGDALIRVAKKTVPLVRTYADVAHGSPLALVNSFGLLEVALRDGHAASTLGCNPGDSIELLLNI